MNKILLRIGGLINLLFVVFYLVMVKPIGDAQVSLSPDIRATVSTLNIHVAFVLLIFSYLAIFHWRDLLTTRLGNITAIAISLFWFLEGISQVVFYRLTAADMPLLGLCFVFGLLHLIPVIREWKKVPNEAQHQVKRYVDMVHKSPERIGGIRFRCHGVVCMLTF